MPHAIPLTRDDLIEGVWRFSRRDRPNAITELRLNLDRSISGGQSSETAWHLDENGVLSFCNHLGKPTVRFDTVEHSDGGFRLEGPYVLKPDTGLCYILDQTPLPRGFAANWMQNLLRDEIARYGWKVGPYTYGRPTVFEGTLAKLTIGAFCSFSVGIAVALGNHRTDTATTFPFVALRHLWPDAPAVRDHVTRGDITIGSDVWVGAGAFIGSGVTIGDGAVIGANSVVTRDVPPYAIVGGSPAAVIRYRFAPEIIERLLALKWWSWDYDRVSRYLPLMMDSDITAFLDAAEKDS